MSGDLEQVVDLLIQLNEALRKLSWIEHYLRRVQHDETGCEIEAWVGRPGESASLGTPFRANTLGQCIDLAMAARAAR
jgi:hypothetical protein